ncbi:MAG: thioredoxin domain-containing protein [Deltaproteobacteria bacterium]|nr:thioredoxin domain-containing protein [Deltaproteobacteria bacterium]
MEQRTDGHAIQEDHAARRARLALVACAILAVVGFGIAMELTTVWVLSRTDPDYQSFCSVSEGMNCETVALSAYSTLAGAPVSVWAEAGYGFAAVFAVVAAVAAGSGLGTGLVVALGAAFAVVSLWLAFVMAALIGSFCVLCLALDVVNAGYLVMALLAAAPRGVWASVRADLAAMRNPAWAAAVVLGGGLALAGAWAYGNNVVRWQVAGTMARAGGPGIAPAADGGAGQCGVAGASATIQMGETPEGHHWVGAATPAIEVQEFTDYQCPHCRRAHMMVRQLLSDYPDRLRVYHRHLPLDQACNPSIKKVFHDRACELSRVAFCAGRQGRFWEMNDFLFQHADEIRKERLSAEDIALRLELNPDVFRCCMDDKATATAIARDVEEGNAHGIKGTPAFVIDGTVYYGKIPDDALARLRTAR